MIYTEKINGKEINIEMDIIDETMTIKVWKALENVEWELLGHYKRMYPMDWVKTINRCLENEENNWEFLYNSKGELKQIKIITIDNKYGEIWNFYIVIKGEKNGE